MTTSQTKFGGLIGLPTSVVISRDGKIQKRFIGLVSHDELEKEIKELALVDWCGPEAVVEFLLRRA